MAKRLSRTRSVVGRICCEEGAWRRRPRAKPLMMRMRGTVGRKNELTRVGQGRRVRRLAGPQGDKSHALCSATRSQEAR